MERVLNEEHAQLLGLMAVKEDLDLFPRHSFGQVLLVKLPHAGSVLLSGDLYHLTSDRPRAGTSAGQVMTVNVDRAQTLASMDRVEAILKNTGSRLVVQHDPADFASLPKFPAFLD